MKIKEAIEGLALQKPPLPITAICRQVRRLAEDLEEEPPSYWVVYRIVSGLPDDLVTLAHQGSKANSESFDLIHRREADRPNTVWQADHTPLDLILGSGTGSETGLGGRFRRQKVPNLIERRVESSRHVDFIATHTCTACLSQARQCYRRSLSPRLPADPPDPNFDLNWVSSEGC